jgi:hypothetical protein
MEIIVKVVGLLHTQGHKDKIGIYKGNNIQTFWGRFVSKLDWRFN